MKIACVFLLVALVPLASSRLHINNGHFVLNGQRVFLSGGNLPWMSYGYDFGDGQWQRNKDRIEPQFKKLHEAGGNSMRFWIHMQGETTPAFNDQGFVIGPDKQGTMLDDMKDMLDTAKKYNILVFPCLWNAAVNQDSHNRLNGLIKDPHKLQSYLDKALKPMVNHVKGHPALGGWDLMNEPEGMMIPDVHNESSCYDTTALKNSGAGWAEKKYLYKDMLRFFNWQAAAIKTTDSGALVTMGVWNPKSNTDHFNMNNHYSDFCLRKAGGRQKGVFDFYQFHSYSWQGKWDEVAPFTHKASDYGLHKPIVVGEFWEQDGGGMDIIEMFKYVYNNGYAGAWSWHLVQRGDNQRKGIAAIKDKTSNGKIPISL
ncbi:mannan endo-1,4-beta-mannosidase [Aplysia californica]|uniref:Mannan endo-1,4-beta-mannosidase n=1 Tax=Aplysia californica TaxID=6500 RepID=A0ABM1A1E6_APLCA|nr:mannan endo-1,4-beta-mannosidase [Aplysia californica]